MSYQGIGQLLVPHYGGNQFDWYVDSANGNDANTGKSAGQAFATIAQLEAQTILAGQKIGLAKGSSWREQLDITANNITVKAYGVGAKPLLDCSDPLTNADFTLTGGTTNVYEIAVALGAVASDNFVNVWEDDTYLTRAASVAACDASPGSYYPSAENGNITLYVHPTGSTNPTSDGKTYDVSIRPSGILVTGSGVTLNGIQARRNRSGSGSIVAGTSAIVTNCDMLDGGKHNFSCGDGSIITNCQSIGCYYTVSSLVLFVYNANTPAGLGVQFVNCYAEGNSTNQAGATAFLGHKNTSGNFGLVQYVGCTAKNCYTGFQPLDTGSCVIENCTVDSTVSIGVLPSVAMTINSCTLNARENAIQFGAGVEVVINGGTYTTTVPLAGPIFSNAASSTLRIFDATINSTTGNTAIYFRSSGGTLEVQRCTFPRAFMYYCYSLHAAIASIVSDYNNFTGVNQWQIGSTDYNFAQWQTLGYDANSIQS